MNVSDEEIAWLRDDIGDVLGRGCVITPRRQGAQYHALRVRARSGDFVLRVPLLEHSPDFDGFTDFAEVVTREASMHARLVLAGISLAPLIAWQARQAGTPRSWMLFEHVRNDDLAALNREQQHQLGEVTRHLHSIAGTNLDTGPGGPGRAAHLLQRTRTRYQFVAGVTPLPPWAAIEPAVHDALAASTPGERCVVHMDLRAPNLCYRGNRLVALLDITNSMVSSPFAELGRLWACGLLTRGFLAGYGRYLTEEDNVRILAYSIDTLAMLVALSAVGRADLSLLWSAGRRLQRACSALTSNHPDPASACAHPER